MRCTKHLVLLPIIAAAAALLIVGCGLPGFDRAFVDLEPTSTGYIFKAPGRGAYPLDDPDAEKQRLAWLAQLVTERHGCPSGYDVVSREPVNHPIGNPVGGIEIYYTVKCRA